ncbi:MAG: xanthine dehydrogenase family protein molybdopterin-binding subunit [Ornithinibacter sp.]
MVGQPGGRVLRVEDAALVRGSSAFTDDLEHPGALHAVFVRSPYAHARIRAVDVSAATALPGVVGVFSGADLGLELLGADMGPESMRRAPIAHDVVRFAGEVVAVAVAGRRAEALDAAELVDVTYEPLAVVLDPAHALSADQPALFAGAADGNLVADGHAGNCDGDALAGAEVVVRASLVNQRLAAVPMEPSAGLAAPDPEHEGSFVLWSPTQNPHAHRDAVAACLELDPQRLRVISPAVGGGFGARIATCPEPVVAVALARRLDRAVRFVETRSETMVTMTHGRGQLQEVALAGTRDGTVTGLEVRVIADAGAYPASATAPPYLTGLMVCGVYDIEKVDFRHQVVLTNTPPIGAYRGAGRPEATALIERAMDLFALELDLDPVDVRRRNLVRTLPHTTPTGADYDSGDYEAALDAVLAAADYGGLRAEQAHRRERGDPLQLGIGVSAYVEWTGFGSEFAACEVDDDGCVTILSGTAAQGQGHETAYAQLVCGLLGVAMEDVHVIQSDTARVARGTGTGGSRSLQVGGSAVSGATTMVLDRAREVAARLLEADPDDIGVHRGHGLGVVGAPDTAISWARIAAAAGDGGLRAELDYAPDGSTYPFGAHLTVVEVDVETGATRLVRHVSIDDAGPMVNPVIVEGQVHGGIAQGLGQALFEEVLFDENGTNVTGTLASYAITGPRDLPSFETSRTQTPTPRNTLGVKGVGEAGTTGSTAAAWNAVADAVSHLGVRTLDMPATPQRVWEAIREASAHST